MAPAARTARIEVFRPGTFTPMQGDALTYSAADLKAVADAYDPETAPAPIVVGHPATDAPAFGWIKAFEYDATEGRLFAEADEIDPAFSDAVRAGRYKKVSLSFFRPDHPANPVPGTWYPKHVGFLGGAAPAVPGLRNVKFAIPADEAATFTGEFACRAGDEAAGILRGLRDFLIEKFGLEDADKALPAYRLEWLESISADPGDKPVVAAPDTPAVPPDQKKEPAVSQQPDPAFAEREATLTAREEQLKARERDLAHADNVAFAEGLVTEGRLLPASKDKVVAILDALPAETSVSFAAGEAITPAAAIRQVLAEQPKVVSFGALDLPEAGQSDGASFAADGKPVDPAGLELHHKALTFQRANPGTAYMDAVRAVS
ncbi:hypothetical protein [Rhodovulum steppense]|uniref:Uncharacterized protein n=1 Tax=Rhodovulum steppense TaxID=540251 RepID=A0A4R1YUN4_9RHOB|nr:hypothetical protein [Rhodovulum steppense]TCM84791.1 hypothetical protein EV216_110109 [Rhodovulum steppense]